MSLLMITATQPSKESTVRPFLKWAGGKSQLLGDLLPIIPTSFDKYVEPFVGGGAMYFALAHHNSVLADSNEELIVTYTVVRDEVELLIERLKSFKNDKDFFYEIRAWDTTKLSQIDRAARLIYLNKTCFNGLYRVNQNRRPLCANA